MPNYTIPPGGASIGLPLNKLNVLTNTGSGAVSVDGTTVASGATYTFPANQPSTQIVDLQGPGTASVRIAQLINRETDNTSSGAWKKVPATPNVYRSTMNVYNPKSNSDNLLVRSVPKGDTAPSFGSNSESFVVYPGTNYPLGAFGDSTRDVYICADTGAVIAYTVEEI
jgi:hypothetical protein